MEALDFQVDVSSGGERGYEVTARAPQGGEATASVRLPMTPRELEALVGRIKDAVIASSATVRRSLTNEERPVRDLGRMLFDTLLADNVRGLLVASRQRAAQEGSRLRLVLRVRPPELARLPWEFLFDASEDDYICLNTPLIRYPTVLQPQLPLQVVPPLRILGMVARPGDQQALAVDDEKRRLEDALDELKRDGRVQLSWVAGQTWRDLQDVMHHGPWHIFHFIGHGGFDASAGEGTLALVHDDGRTYALRASGLAMLLRGHPSLRLVLLNACDTGRASALDPFSSVAGALMRRGIPAVLAMQFEITDLAAVEFSRTFYGSIAHQQPVDVSVTEARQAIQLALPGTLEWGTPVLYLRSPAGYIFDLADAPAISADLSRTEGRAMAAKEEFDGQLEDLYTDGLNALYTGQWGEAVEIFRTIIAQKRDYKKAALKLEEARRQQQLAARYTRACATAAADQWAEAIEHFAALLAAEPDYRDVRAQLARAKREHAAAELRAEALSLHRAKRWQAVLAVTDRLKSLDPDATDLNDLADSARKQLELAELTHALETNYQQAIHHLDAGAWGQALAALTTVQAVDKHYRDTAELMARARQELSHRKVLTTLAKDLHELLAQKRELARAEEPVELHHREAPKTSDIEEMHSLGNLLRQRGELDQAETWYRRAIDGGSTEAMNDLGSMLEQRGKFGEAESWYLLAAEAGNVAAMNNQGDLLERRGEPGEAENWYLRAAEAANVAPVGDRGDLLERRGEPGEAESRYRRAAESGDATAMFGLADLLDQVGDLDEAEIWYRRAIDEGSTQAMNKLGFMLERRGELSEAERWYRRAIEGGNAVAMFYLAGLLEQRGELDEAERWYRGAADAGIVAAMSRPRPPEIEKPAKRWWSGG